MPHVSPAASCGEEPSISTSCAGTAASVWGVTSRRRRGAPARAGARRARTWRRRGCSASARRPRARARGEPARRARVLSGRLTAAVLRARARARPGTRARSTRWSRLLWLSVWVGSGASAVRLQRELGRPVLRFSRSCRLRLPAASVRSRVGRDDALAALRQQLQARARRRGGSAVRACSRADREWMLESSGTRDRADSASWWHFVVARKGRRGRQFSEQPGVVRPAACRERGPGGPCRAGVR